MPGLSEAGKGSRGIAQLMVQPRPGRYWRKLHAQPCGRAKLLWRCAPQLSLIPLRIIFRRLGGLTLQCRAEKIADDVGGTAQRIGIEVGVAGRRMQLRMFQTLQLALAIEKSG